MREIPDPTHWARLQELAQYSNQQLFIMQEMCGEWIKKRELEQPKRDSNEPIFER